MAKVSRSVRRRLVFGLLIGVLVLMAGCVVYVGTVAGLSSRPVSMPALTGAYQVGRTSYEWTDRSRMDPLAPQGGPRELSVWLWYPAQRAGRAAEYMSGLWRGLEFGPPVGWFESDFEAVKVRAVENAPVAKGSFSVVVLEPGMGFSIPQYTALAENLASHGYLVAGVTPTYSANLTVLQGKKVENTAAGNPPDLGAHSGKPLEEANQLVTLWAADARFVAGQVAGLTGQFAGKVGQGAVTYVGHSFGGAASLEACHLDRRCVGAVDLDGTQFGTVVREGLTVPSMILSSEDSCVTGRCGPKAKDVPSDREAANSLVAAGVGKSWRFIVTGTRHFDFTDYGVYFVAPPVRNLLALGSIDNTRDLAIQHDCILAFLDHVMRHASEAALDGLPGQHSELTIG